MLCLGSLGSSKDSLITERDSFALLLLIGRLRLLGERFKGYLELLIGWLSDGAAAALAACAVLGI